MIRSGDSVTQSPLDDAGQYSSQRGRKPRESPGGREPRYPGEESGQEGDKADNPLGKVCKRGKEDSIGKKGEEYTADHGQGDQRGQS